MLKKRKKITSEGPFEINTIHKQQKMTSETDHTVLPENYNQVHREQIWKPLPLYLQSSYNYDPQLLQRRYLKKEDIKFITDYEEEVESVTPMRNVEESSSWIPLNRATVHR